MLPIETPSSFILHFFRLIISHVTCAVSMTLEKKATLEESGKIFIILMTLIHELTSVLLPHFSYILIGILSLAKIVLSLQTLYSKITAYTRPFLAHTTSVLTNPLKQLSQRFSTTFQPASRIMFHRICIFLYHWPNTHIWNFAATRHCLSNFSPRSLVRLVCLFVDFFLWLVKPSSKFCPHISHLLLIFLAFYFIGFYKYLYTSFPH